MKTDQNLPSRTHISWVQSLSGKLTIVHLLGLFCLLIATTCVVWFIQRPYLLHKQTKNNDLAGGETVSEIALQITAAESLVKGLSQLAEVLPPSAQNYSSAARHLLGEQQTESFIVGGGIWLEPAFAGDVATTSFAWIRDLGGRLQSQKTISDPNQNGFEDEPWYAPVRFANPGELYWSHSYQQPETGRTIVTCAAPIFRSSQFAGAATVDFDLERLPPLVAGLQKNQGYAFLLDRNNRFLSFPEPERVRLHTKDAQGNWGDEYLTLGQLAKIAPAYNRLFAQLDHFDHEQLQKVQEHPGYDTATAASIKESTRQLDDADAIFASALLGHAMKTGETPAKRFEMEDPHLGEHANAAVYQIPGPYWKLVQVTPTAGMISVVNQHLKHILTWLLLLETGIVLLSLIVTRMLVGRPIKMIFDRVKGLVKSNGEGRLDDTPGHELGVVAHQYNRRSKQAANAIDELKRTQEELNRKEEQSAAVIHRCEQQTRSILNASPDAILTLDKAGTIVGANGSAETVFKRDYADILGRSLDAFVKIPLNHSIYTFLAQEDRELFGRRLEATGKHQDKQEFAIELTIAEVESDPKIFVAYVRDITERRLARQELVQKRERAQDAVRSKDAFLARMSHELRTPLNVILGFTEALHEGIYGPVNRQQANTLGRIRDRGTDLLRLIDDVLDVAEIGAGELKLQFGPVQVPDMCSGAISKVKTLATKKEIMIQQHLDARVATILADQRRLQQILTNLLSNAVKFTPVGGKVTLEVKGNPSKDTIDFTVTDTGIGISPEDMDVLFQPFVQVDGGLTRQYPGTGIGLCIVYHLAEMHGGRVAASSEVQRGSSFTVTIPWKLPQPTLLNPETEADSTSEKKTFLAPFPPARSVPKGESSEGLSKPRTEPIKNAASILPSKQHLRPEDIARVAGFVKTKGKVSLPANSIASDQDVRNLLTH